MSKISNYTELVAERKKTEGRISEQKMIIREGMNTLKEKLEPYLYLFSTSSIFDKGKSSGALLKAITSVGIDILTSQNKIKAIAGYLVPIIAKKFSTQAGKE